MKRDLGLDLLVNNAGIAISENGTTEDGFEVGPCRILAFLPSTRFVRCLSVSFNCTHAWQGLYQLNLMLQPLLTLVNAGCKVDVYLQS